METTQAETQNLLQILTPENYDLSIPLENLFNDCLNFISKENFIM